MTLLVLRDPGENETDFTLIVFGFIRDIKFLLIIQFEDDSVSSLNKNMLAFVNELFFDIYYVSKQLYESLTFGLSRKTLLNLRCLAIINLLNDKKVFFERVK